jgi:hypothetical protein
MHCFPPDPSRWEKADIPFFKGLWLAALSGMTIAQ